MKPLLRRIRGSELHFVYHQEGKHQRGSEGNYVGKYNQRPAETEQRSRGGELKIPAGFDSCCSTVYLCLSQVT